MKRLLAYLLLLSNVLLISGWQSDTSLSWTQPTIIMGTNGRLGDSAHLLADLQGDLHLFFTHVTAEDAQTGIDYMHWDGRVWSQPVNILLEPTFAGVRNLQAVVDSTNQIHLIWVSQGILRYATAPATEASRAINWRVNSSLAGVLSDVEIAVAPDDTIYIAFFEDSAVRSLSVLRSLNYGEDWESPMVVTLPDTNRTPNQVQLSISPANEIHLAWGELNETNANKIFYTHLLADGFTWKQPLLIDSGSADTLGMLSTENGRLHLFWEGDSNNATSLFHQWSTDAGVSWLSRNQFENRGRVVGSTAFAVDSENKIHFTTASSFMATLDEGAKSEYVDILGEPLRVRLRQLTGSNLDHGLLAVTRGNQLHHLFITEFNQIWYTSAHLSYPPLETTFIPAEPTIIEATPIESDSATVVDTESNYAPFPTENKSSRNTSNILMFAAILPLALFLLVFVLLRNRQL